MGSIFEYLSDNHLEANVASPKSFTLSVADSFELCNSQAQGTHNSPYVLQPPPFKTDESTYIGRIKSLDSPSDYHSSTTSLSTLPQLGDTASYLIGTEQPTAFSNTLFEETRYLHTSNPSSCRDASYPQQRPYTMMYNDKSGGNTELTDPKIKDNDSNARNSLRNKANEYLESDNQLDTVPGNHISHCNTCNNSCHAANSAYTIIENLTDSNLIINPHHFDPL